MYVAFLTALTLSTAVPTAQARAHLNMGSATHVAAAERQTGRLTLQFRDLDTDNDGVITRSEWRGSMATFRTYDLNGDGVISRAEFREQNIGDGRDNRGDEFESLDANNDGRIQRREWDGNNTEFNSLDRNRDGVLSRWEFNGGQAGRDLAGDRSRTATAHEVVRVDSRQNWNDTGMFVRAGDTITIHADGTIQLSDNPSDVSDPTGARSGRRAPNAPIGSAPAGALIARIGDSAPILVGANGTIASAPATGRLFLGVNDDHFPDNAGEFRATVDVDRERR